MYCLRTAITLAFAASLTLAGTAFAQDDPCLPPGVLIVTDPGADVSPAGNTQHEIEAVYVSQLNPASSLIQFTIEVAELTDEPTELALSSTWRVFFFNPEDNNEYFVTMETCDATTIPSYSYGWVNTTTGVNTGLGDAVSGSFNSDGFITIVMDRNSFIDGDGATVLPPLVGSTLFGIRGDVRIFAGVQCTGIISQLDGTDTGSYTIVDECPTPTELCCSDNGGSPLCSLVSEGECVGLPNGQVIADCSECLSLEGPCDLPGLTVATDGVNDVAQPGGSQQDIEAVFMAQAIPFPAGNDLNVTMKVAQLAATGLDLPPNTIWRVKFLNPDDGNVYFTQMETCDPSELPSFSWGWVDPVTGVNSGRGAIQGSFSPDGFITMTVGLSQLVDDAAPDPPEQGDVLGSVLGETVFLAGTLCSGLLQNLDQTSTSFSYQTITSCPENCCYANGTMCETVDGGECVSVFNGNVTLNCDFCEPTDVEAIPSAFGFELAGPNPFRGGTALRYRLPSSQHVDIAVYNVAGERVRTLLHATRSAGLHTVPLNTQRAGAELGAGVYMVRIRAGSFEQAVRVIHLK